MGQTLTHGIYLPDEGERNCYNGLAANWQLLDGAVGTVAEHTTALAGKAPAVHTHVKADITDFPAYGNTAGTICEGNDSRLSDARTPVAHTHTKSDITDLFNSANTWTDTNTFQGGGIQIKDTAAVSAGGYGAAVYFRDYQGNRYGYIQHYVTSDSYNNIIIGADGTGRIQVNSYLVPYAANAVNFGTSDLQWKSVYAQSYYYNGVAWGLDQTNTWSNNQIIASSDDKCYYVKDTVYELGQTYSSGEHLGGLTIQDKNGSVVGLIDIADRSYGSTEMRIRVQQKFDPDSNNRSTNGTILWNEMVFGIASNKTNYVRLDANLIGPNHDLGTSSFKWTTLNGINPGALSIFNPLGSQDPIDIPNTWVTDGSAWNALNVSNMGDGWICLTYRLCGANDYILVRFGGASANVHPSMLFPATMLQDSKYYLYMLVPVAKAMGNIYLEIKLDSNAVLVKHSFIPAYGTV